MDFAYSPTQQSIIDAITAIMADFGDDYWLAADRDGRFPEEFYAAIAAWWLAWNCHARGLWPAPRLEFPKRR